LRHAFKQLISLTVETRENMGWSTWRKESHLLLVRIGTSETECLLYEQSGDTWFSRSCCAPPVFVFARMERRARSGVLSLGVIRFMIACNAGLVFRLFPRIFCWVLLAVRQAVFEPVGGQDFHTVVEHIAYSSAHCVLFSNVDRCECVGDCFRMCSLSARDERMPVISCWEDTTTCLTISIEIQIDRVFSLPADYFAVTTANGMSTLHQCWFAQLFKTCTELRGSQLAMETWTNRFPLQ
jgi:hypothetical protein